jgi:hypothetical protein
MNRSEIDSAGREPDEFERQLMEALRRADAPDGFVARVLERVAAPAKTSPARQPRFLALPVQAWAAAIIAVLALGALVANQVRIRRERAQIAQAQFETAMRITDRALEQMRVQLERAGLKVR